jgi:hypothetical protein
VEQVIAILCHYEHVSLPCVASHLLEQGGVNTANDMCSSPTEDLLSAATTAHRTEGQWTSLRKVEWKGRLHCQLGTQCSAVQVKFVNRTLLFM